MPRAVPLEYLIDPYEVLQVSKTATVEEIRKAFKRLVLKAHPDKNPNRQEWSGRKVKELFHAFEMIGDAERRRQYDELARQRLEERIEGVKRQTWPPPTEKDLFFFRKNDPECLALRILYLLLHQRGDEAEQLLTQSEQALGTDFLSEQLDRNDYLDCLFLLGEHLIKRKRFWEAHRRLVLLYRQERPMRFRRHYFELVVDALKSLYLRQLPRTLEPAALVEALQGALRELEWTPKELARLRLTLAKAFHAMGQKHRVEENLQAAMRADPGCRPSRRRSAEMAAEKG
ncbi:MAG: J domain-containing protein [Planctomycetes bacterium]|nr:J domain-containing protein [Planctomycetota bacterium]